MSPSEYERTEQGDDPSCPSDRLTDEEARKIMGYHPDPRVKDTLAELLALRACGGAGGGAYEARGLGPRRTSDAFGSWGQDAGRHRRRPLGDG